jgi:hypothetical protein
MIPRCVPIQITKNTPQNTRKYFENSPSPNHSTAIGTNEMGGIGRRSWMMGEKKLRASS